MPALENQTTQRLQALNNQRRTKRSLDDAQSRTKRSLDDAQWRTKTEFFHRNFERQRPNSCSSSECFTIYSRVKSISSMISVLPSDLILPNFSFSQLRNSPKFTRLVPAMRAFQPFPLLFLALAALTTTSGVSTLPSAQNIQVSPPTKSIPTMTKSLLRRNTSLRIIDPQPSNGTDGSFLDPEDKRGGGGSSGGGGGGGGGGHGGSDGASSGSKGGGAVAAGGVEANGGHGGGVPAHSMASNGRVAMWKVVLPGLGMVLARMR